MTSGQGFLALAALLALPAAASDSSLLRVTDIPMDMAQTAAAAAVAQCREDGYRVSAAVVDRAGVLKSQIRADGAGPHTVDSSLRKAYTAASLGEPTGKLARLAAARSHLRGLHEMNASILLLGGGYPIRMEDQIVGGIGVGGAPGDTLDEACARAGLAAIGAAMPTDTEGDGAHPQTESP